jgi:hypothetical protein
MNCANHPAVQAAAYCRTCGKALCANCTRPVQGVIYCESCLAARLGHPPQIANQPGVTLPADTRLPSPGLAAALGFIPGVGAMYNGQFLKGFIHVMVFVIMIWMANEYGPIMVPVFFAYFFYSVFDAYKTAHAVELGQPVPDPFGLERMFGGQTGSAPSAPASSVPPGTLAPAPVIADVSGPRHSAPIGAIVLIVLGVLFLLDNTGWFEFHWVHHFWPLILIALGGWLLARRLGLFGLAVGECGCERCKSRGIMGPAILLTLGVLFLVAEVVPFAGFSHTWPAVLIVVGLVKVFQGNASTAGHIRSGPSTAPPTKDVQAPPSEVQPPPTEVHNG